MINIFVIYFFWWEYYRETTLLLQYKSEYFLPIFMLRTLLYIFILFTPAKKQIFLLSDFMYNTLSGFDRKQILTVIIYTNNLCMCVCVWTLLMNTTQISITAVENAFVHLMFLPIFVQDAVLSIIILKNTHLFHFDMNIAMFWAKQITQSRTTIFKHP